MNLTVQWPDTEHPSLSARASAVRSLMSGGLWDFRVPKQTRPLYATYGDPDPPDVTEPEFRVELLTVHKVVGPAPYVGRPFVYMWKVAVGDGGRWVAGSAEIHHIPEDRKAS